MNGEPLSSSWEDFGINWEKREVLVRGERLKIANAFDIDGDETDQRDMVMSIVAGPTAKGLWVGITLSEEL